MLRRRRLRSVRSRHRHEPGRDRLASLRSGVRPGLVLSELVHRDAVRSRAPFVDHVGWPHDPRLARHLRRWQGTVCALRVRARDALRGHEQTGLGERRAGPHDRRGRRRGRYDLVSGTGTESDVSPDDCTILATAVDETGSIYLHPGKRDALGPLLARFGEGPPCALAASAKKIITPICEYPSTWGCEVRVVASDERVATQLGAAATLWLAFAFA